MKKDREHHRVTGMPQKMERASAAMITGEKLNNVVIIICFRSVSGVMIDDMGIKRATDQVHDYSQTLGK